MASTVIDLVDSSEDESDDLRRDSDTESVASTFSQVSYSSQATSTSRQSTVSYKSQSSAKSSSSVLQIFSQSADAPSRAITSTIKRTTSSTTERSSSSKAKQEELEIKRQMTGKYKHEEMGIVLSSSLQATSMMDSLMTTCLTDNQAFNGIFFADSFAHNLVRFTYRPKVLGGCANIEEKNVVTMPFAVVIFPTSEFVRLADMSTHSLRTQGDRNNKVDATLSHDFSYPELVESLNQAESVLVNLDGCPYDTRVVFLLIDLDTEILAYRKTKPKTALFSVDDVLAYLLHEKQLEVFLAKSEQHACEYLYTWSKILATAIYKGEGSEFDAKTRCQRLRADDDASKKQQENHELKETWISMIEMIPNTSRKKARTFVDNTLFSCPFSAVEACERAIDPVALIASKFPKGEIKISKSIQNMLMQYDPTAPIGE